jgi:hypothetical protein
LAIAARIASVGRVTVSERRSIGVEFVIGALREEFLDPHGVWPVIADVGNVVYPSSGKGSALRIESEAAHANHRVSTRPEREWVGCLRCVALC